MMVETKISDLRKFQKEIAKLIFTLTPMPKGPGKFRLRAGKKFILIDCPSKEIGECTKAALMAALKNTSDKVAQIIYHTENNAKQLELELFPVTEEGKESDGEPKEHSDKS
jgi:hypothetical protein